MSLEDLTKEAPFDYRASRDGSVHLSYRGRVVTTLKGKAAAKLLNKLEGADRQSAQLLMAKATGQFKHGNERLTSNKRSRK